jgi:uncharacterized protein YbcV (DUF1398 family)
MLNPVASSPTGRPIPTLERSALDLLEQRKDVHLPGRCSRRDDKPRGQRYRRDRATTRADVSWPSRKPTRTGTAVSAPAKTWPILQLSSKVVTDRMFTIQQIDDLHDRLGSMDTFAEYVRALESLGVEAFTSYLTDGHSEFIGRDGYAVKSPAAHERLNVSDASNREKFLEHLTLHSQHKTSYLEMSKGLAESGIEKWIVDMNRMTMSYVDRAGNEMLVEAIE